jgi:hypothetical protein
MSDKLKEAIKKIALAGMGGICSAEVLTVDKAKNTCSVKVLKNDDELLDVTLLALEGDFGAKVVVYPTLGSVVLIAYLGVSGDAASVIKTTEIDEVLIGGSEFGGLVKVGVLVEKLNKLEQRFNDFKTKFNAHVHTGVTTGPGTSAVSNLLITSIDLTETEQTDLENERIKHG